MNRIGATREVAEFASRTKYPRLPRAVVDKAKQLVLDQLGVQLACSTLPWNTLICEYAKNVNAPGRSTIANSGLRTHPEFAALANATFGHGFEIDDYHPQALSHPGCVAVPASLAVGEARSVTGKELITAVVIASEIILRIGLSIGRSMVQERGIHETCVEGTFGAAAAVGSMLNFDEAVMVNALSIAGSHSSGTVEYAQTGGDVKRLHAGLGAMGGIRSASLARLGLTGPATILEGKRGIFQAFANTYDLDKLTHGLGEVYHMLNTCFKLYCCNGLTHVHIDAVSQILTKNELRPDDIQEIIIGADRFSLSHAGTVGPEPKDMTGAQFSTHFSLGLTVVKGANDFLTYMNALESNFRDPQVLDIAHRVKMVFDEERDRAWPEKNSCKATVITKDGRILSAVVTDSKGTIGRPMSHEELEAKFMGLATVAVSNERADGIRKMVARLEDLDDVNRLTELLIS